jgi:hypothetical protein
MHLAADTAGPQARAKAIITSADVNPRLIGDSPGRANIRARSVRYAGEEIAAAAVDTDMPKRR